MENQTDKQLAKAEEKKLEVEKQLAMAERLEAAAERMEAANAEAARLQSNEALSGTSEGHIETKPVVPLTPIEYANQVRLGLVNPLQADGYL